MTTSQISAPSHPPPAGRAAFGLPGAGGAWANFGLAGAIAGVLAVLVLVGGLVWAAATGQAPPAQRPVIFGGSLVLDDYRPLTVVDVATGAVTVQLEGVYQQVGAASYFDVEAVPTSAGTMLVNRVTGSFNMLGNDNYVLGPPSNGISLGPLTGSTSAAGFAGTAATFIVRYAPDSTVSLVDAATVQAGARAQASRTGRTVRPVGFARLGGLAASTPGSTTVAGGALWVMRHAGPGCQLERAAPSARSAQGLSTTLEARWKGPCRRAALETSGSSVGLALPGRVEIFGARSRRSVEIAGTAADSEYLPVQGTTGELWYLTRLPGGWSLLGVGVGPGDRSPGVVGPLRLDGFGASSSPAVPAMSGGLIYTLDQDQRGQPTLWAITPGTARMRPVKGAPTYPARSPTEKATFQGAQVLVDGPRVVFNNPESLLAVIVFTDGSHPPVVVDKSTAVVVSAAGPGDVNVKRQPRPHSRGGRPPNPNPNPNPARTTTPTTVAQPASQPVTPQVNCATTTEKPYEPQVSSVTPSDQAALVKWGYHLLSQQDCLPSTWSVTVAALGGAPQPSHPLQVVDGQQQLLVRGLLPATSYDAVVTAYVNGQSTSSAPWRFRTTAVGPGAPARVNAHPDGNGGWVVSWAPCNQPRCVVPAVKWSVIGSACAGSVVATPPALTVPGQRTSVTVGPGNSDALLGSSLQFSVQGTSAAGLTGAPTSSGNCTTSWQPPDPSLLQLLAATVPAGSTLTADLRVSVSGDVVPVVAFGGDHVVFTYSVGTSQVGPTSASEVTVTGLSPAHQYLATVTVTPVGHPEASATVSSPPFSRTLPWPPALQLQATGSVGADPNSGTVVATLQGLPQGSFAARGSVTCGSVAQPVSAPVVGSQFEVPLNLDTMGGRCALSVELAATAKPDPYGVPSPTLATRFTIGGTPSYSFDAIASDNCHHGCSTLDLVVDYSGPGAEPAGTEWSVVASNAGGCSSSLPAQAFAAFPVSLKWPIGCQAPTITISWVYLGQPGSTTAGLPGLFLSPTSAPSTAPPTAPPTSPPTTPSAPTTLPVTTTAPTTTTTSTTGCVVPAARCPSTTTAQSPTTTTAPGSTTVLPSATTTGTSTTSTTAGTTTTSVPAQTTSSVPATSTTTLPTTTSPATTSPTTTPSTTTPPTTTPFTTTAPATTALTAAGAAASSPACFLRHCLSSTRSVRLTGGVGLMGSVGTTSAALQGLVVPLPPVGGHGVGVAWALLAGMLAVVPAASLAWCVKACRARTRRAR